MLNAPSSPQQRLPETIYGVFGRMKELYAQAATDTPDGKRILDGMSSQIIGETTQQAHQALIIQETCRLDDLAKQQSWTSAQLAQEVEAMIQKVTEGIFREHWYESTLSTPSCPIPAAIYGTSMFRYDLRMLMTEDTSAESFAQFGWIMFDINALRSFKDCTSHEHTTQFLQQIVCIFMDPEGSTNRILREDGVKVIPMAAGGDEFVLYLRSGKPLNPEYVDKIIRSFQTEISSSSTLKEFLDFNDERVLKKYGLPSRLQRYEFARLSPEEQKIKLAQIRSSLPQTFVPSMAGGGATLAEGTLQAEERDADDLNGAESFHSLRRKIIEGTMELAENRQKKNKEEELRHLATEDPLSHAFRLRNGENRKLQSQNDVLMAQLEDTRKLLMAAMNAKKE